MFDEDNYVLKNSNYIFTTEGHLFPVSIDLHEKFGNYNKSNVTKPTLYNIPFTAPKSNRTCAMPKIPGWKDYFANIQKESEQSPAPPLPPSSQLV